MFTKISSWFKKEKCFACDKILTRKDKREGGCGFSGGLNGIKSFSYCKECSYLMINEVLSGKKPKLQKIIEKKIANQFRKEINSYRDNKK